VFVKTASGKTVNLVDVMAGDIITVEALEKLTTITCNNTTTTNTALTTTTKTTGTNSATTTTTTTTTTTNNNNNSSSNASSTFKSNRLPLQPFMSGMDTTTNKEVEMNNAKADNNNNNNNNNTQSKSFDGSCGGGGGGGETAVKEMEIVPPTASPTAELPLWASSRDIQPVKENEEKKSIEKM
jgi:hypothetical protein